MSDFFVAKVKAVWTNENHFYVVIILVVVRNVFVTLYYLENSTKLPKIFHQEIGVLHTQF